MGAEFAGTFALVVVGPSAAAAFAGDHSFGALCFIAAVFGAVVGASILAFGWISGSHINPAVTVAHAVRDRKWDRAVALYVLVQMAAGLAAGACLTLFFRADGSSAHLGSTSLAAGVSATFGLALEIGGTFALALTALSVHRLFRPTIGHATMVGATLLLLIVLIAPLTGASFNPSRSAGPALASGYFDNLWVYLVGPLAGGTLAGAVARVLGLKGTAESP